MPKELFNQTLITTPTEPDDDDRLSLGQPSVSGSKNIKWSYFKTIVQSLLGTFDKIIFNLGLSNPTYQEGVLFYDDEKKSLSGYNEQSDITLNYGEELIAPIVRNISGSQIDNGQPVYISGVDSGYYTIDLANAQFSEKSRQIYVATHDIPNNSNGRITRIGEVGGFDTSVYAIADMLYLSVVDGVYSTSIPDDGAFIVKVAQVKTVASDGIIYVDPTSSDLTVEVTDTNGFPGDQRTGTTLSFVDGTRTFTITPTGTDFHYYELGIKYEQTSAQSVIIPDVEGLHVIYFDENTLTSLANPNDGQIDNLIRNNSLVAYIYWNATNSEYIYLGDERHGISMSPSTHAYLHFTRGAQHLQGLTLNTILTDDSGDDDEDAQFGSDSGLIADEDIITSLPAVASTTGLPIYYLDGANADLRKDTNTGFSVLTAGTGRLAYNEWTGAVWQLTEITNNDFILCHVFATNEIDNSLIAFVGQTDYPTLTQARNGANNEIASLITVLPIQEFVPVATLIFQTSTGYANSVKARIRSTDTGADYINWLTSDLAQGASPTDHQNLANLLLAADTVTYGHIDDQVQTIVGEKIFSDNLQCDGQATGGSSIESFSATKTFDLNNGNSQQMTLTGNVSSLALSNKVNGGSYLIYLIQDVTGGRTLPIPGASFGTKTTNSVDDFNTDANGGNIININVSPSGVTVWTLEVYTP